MQNKIKNYIKKLCSTYFVTKSAKIIKPIDFLKINERSFKNFKTMYTVSDCITATD